MAFTFVLREATITPTYDKSGPGCSCPGHSPLERFRWFWALDRHHYLHHIDTRANVNFLMPLGDLLLGTLRTRMTPAEAARWPSYAAARNHVLPSCRRVPRS